MTLKKQNPKPTQIWTSAFHHINVFLETYKRCLSWRLSSGSVMTAHVKLSWCQVLEFSAVADEPMVGSMWGRGDEGGICCPGGIDVGAPMVPPDGHPGVLTAPLGLLPQGFLVNLLLSSWLGEEGLCWQPGAAGPLLLTVTGPAGCGAQGSCHNWPPVPSPWP